MAIADIEALQAQQLNTAPGRDTLPIWSDAGSCAMGYWTKPNGHVKFMQVGGNTPLEQLLPKGWMRLFDYGIFASAGGSDGWDRNTDPFYGLVLSGGQHEFPPDQLLNLGWHRPAPKNGQKSHRLLSDKVDQAMAEYGIERLEALEVVFPQLRGVAWADHPCSFCPGESFAGLIEGDIDRGRQILLQHEAIAHPEDVRTRSGKETLHEFASANADIMRTLAESNINIQQLFTAFMTAVQSGQFPIPTAAVVTAAPPEADEDDDEEHGEREAMPRRRGRPPRQP